MAARKSVSWRHQLESREPAIGFASRLAALNGIPLIHFLQEMLIPAADLEYGRDSGIEALAVVGGVDKAALRSASPTINRESPIVSIGNEYLHRSSFKQKRFFFCPHCIAEDMDRFSGPDHARPWLRLEWTISHFRSCKAHRVYLIPTPVTARYYRSFDFAEEIRDIIPRLPYHCENSEPAPISHFQEWLTRRLDGSRDASNWLDDIELYAAIDMCEALGLSMLSESLPKAKNAVGLHTLRSRVLPATTLAVAADLGFTVASGGEETIASQLLQMKQAQMDAHGVWGLREIIREFYDLVEKTKGQTEYAKARILLRRFIVETFPLPAGTDVLGETLDKQQVHTIRSLALESGLHQYTIRNLLENKGMVSTDPSEVLPDHRTTFKIEEVAEFLDDLRGAMTSAQVRILAGISIVVMRCLMESGLLPKLVESSPDSRVKTLFARSTVEKFVDKLFSGAVSLSDVSSAQVSVNDLRKATGIRIDQAIDLLVSGKIWKGLLRGERRFDALVVDVNEVMMIVNPTRASGVNKTEFAAMIVGMEKGAVGTFIAEGHLQVRDEFCSAARRTIPIIPREVADHFQKTYVSAREVAECIGSHSRTVRLMLDHASIRPVFDPQKFLGSFYLRSQVDTYLSSKSNLDGRTSSNEAICVPQTT